GTTTSLYDWITPIPFQVVVGLDGKVNSISLESGSEKGCFVYCEINDKGSTSIKLSSKSNTADSGFKQAACFNLREGLSEFHPMSFVAKGAKRISCLCHCLA
ncbi:hypothetical protein GIB67_016562, partial [Kingdonia uniflora]